MSDDVLKLTRWKFSDYVNNPEDVILHIEIWAEDSDEPLAKELVKTEGFKKLKELVNASRQSK